jgi:hypothetical protein
MSMRDFLCELKLPAVLISVVTIVWCTALGTQQEQQYYPPGEEFKRLQQVVEGENHRNVLEDDQTVRLELEP